MDGKRILTIAILIIIFALNATYFVVEAKKTQQALINEKYRNVENYVNMLKVVVGSDIIKEYSYRRIFMFDITEHNRLPDTLSGQRLHRATILDSVGFINQLPLVYACVFVKIEDELIVLSKDNVEQTFDPRNHPEFMEAIHSSNSGKIVLNVTPDIAGDLVNSSSDLHLHYNWMPVDHEDILVVAGVTKYSITVFSQG